MMWPLEVTALFWQHTLYLSYKVTDVTHFASLRPHWGNLFVKFRNSWLTLTPSIWCLFVFKGPDARYLPWITGLYNDERWSPLNFLSVKWRGRNDGIFCHNAKNTSKREKKNIWEFMNYREIVHWIRLAPYRVLSYKLILHERKVAESGWLRLWWLFQLQLKLLSV